MCGTDLWVSYRIRRAPQWVFVFECPALAEGDIRMETRVPLEGHHVAAYRSIIRSVWVLVPALFAVVIASCSEQPKETGEVTLKIANLKWPEMKGKQKGLYMQEVVLPSMKELFSDDADFGCMDCHGENADAVSFKMPNTLDPLDPANMPFQSEDEEVRKIAKRMLEVVTPKMVELLSATAYDPKTQKGFGCFGCHAMAGAK